MTEFPSDDLIAATQDDAVAAVVARIEAAGLTPVVDRYAPRYDGDVVAYVHSVETAPGTMGHPLVDAVIR